MTIRNKPHPNANPLSNCYRRKADQNWDLAGCARMDGDLDAAATYTMEARKFEALYREALTWQS